MCAERHNIVVTKWWISLSAGCLGTVGNMGDAMKNTNTTWNRLIVGVVLTMTWLAAASTVTATTLNVGAGQTYATISNALVASHDGDIIQIVTNVQTESGIVITNSVTIQGYGPANTIVQGATSRSNNAAGRVFTCNNAAKVVTIQNMTIQYGCYSNATDNYGGAGVYAALGNVTVANCWIQMNDSFTTPATSYGGGGVSYGANSSTGTSLLTINNCTVCSNTASGSSGNGGGISGKIVGNLYISGTSFFGNQCAQVGGAVYVSGFLNGFQMVNSTLYNNTAGGGSYGGGGVYYNGPSGITGLVNNCTIVSNRVTGSSNAGGIQLVGTGTLFVNSTIVAGNINSNSSLLETTASPNTRLLCSNCLFQGSTTSGSGTTTLTACKTGQSPSLLPLANNGGPTPTMALQSGSPCIDAGINPLGLAYDQRGMGYNRVVGGTPDMGACEYGNTFNPTGLIYTSTVFAESPANNGTINNAAPMSIQLLNAIFNATNGEDLVASGKLQVNNQPPGLTFVAQQIISNMLSVTVNGAASHHNSSNNVSNLTFAFTDAAFSNVVGGAASVLNSTANSLQVQFLDPVLTWSGTNFTESVYNDGSIANTLGISLVGDYLTGANNENFVAAGKVAVSNVPPGLTAVITRTGPTNLTAALTGKATQHDFANSISNLTFVLQTTAFSNTPANVVTNYAMTNLLVNFISNSITYYVATNGVETAAGTSWPTALATITNAHAKCRSANSDVILLGPGTFTQPNNTITKSVVIQGQGAGVTIVQAANVRSNSPMPGLIFILNSAGSVFAISDMTIQYGYTNNATGGGAIYGTAGTGCTLARCVLQQNDAPSGSGGAIYSGIPLVVSNCTFSSNYCAGNGGAIYAPASLYYGCTLNENLTTNGGGGAIYSTGYFTMQNDTFVHNHAGANKQGGAVFSYAGGGIATHCTFVSNICNGPSGGAMAWNGAYNSFVQNSLFYTNMAGSAGTALSELGVAGSPVITVTNCFFTATFSIAQITTNLNCVFSTNPKVGPLANNGGPTMTCALLPGSPCIGQANPATALPYDQRGYKRDSASDIGAFEYGAHAPNPSGSVIYFR